MKKLLLILICLFVSFEVKLKSDDLSGKKIVCEDSNYIIGFNFVDNTKVKKSEIDIKRGTSYSSASNYKTTPVEIVAGVYSIDRLTLKLGSSIDRLTLKFARNTECKLIEGNFDSHMQDRLEMIVNEIKSKQKIYSLKIND